MDTTYHSTSLGHLGLVSGMIDELGLVEEIDKLLPSSLKTCQLSIGFICKSLIINGLGFSQRTLYMVSSFFSDKSISLFLSPDVEAIQLNDSVLGRALDSLHEYGCTELFSQLSPLICQKEDLS